MSTGFPRIAAILPPFSLMATTGQLSYPLNSENASPFGTLSAYLSSVEAAQPPATASVPVMNEMANINFRFIARFSFTEYCVDVPQLLQGGRDHSRGAI